MKKFLRILSLVSIVVLFVSPVHAALNLDRLSEKDIKKVESLLVKLTPLIQKREQEKNLATLTFDELYRPLTKRERSFLKNFRNLDAKKLNVRIPFQGIATGKEDLVLIRGQMVGVPGKPGETRILAPQFLPPEVYAKYKVMMEAMQKDLGRKLYIESGYRSSAYQLYLFVFYLKNHDYSIRETVKFVALPGYSEHGSVKHQALDFINEDGINGEDNPLEFEVLPEYEWLLKNAGRFGFVLSYPKNSQSGITYEPWHWRYQGIVSEEKWRDL